MKTGKLKTESLRTGKLETGSLDDVGSLDKGRKSGLKTGSLGKPFAAWSGGSDGFFFPTDQ